MNLIEIEDRASWDQLVNDSEFGHPLQLWGWGEVKKINGWEVVRLADFKNLAGVQVLLKTIPKTKYKLAYIARGPVAGSHQIGELLDQVVALLKIKYNNSVVSLRVEADLDSSVKPSFGKNNFKNAKNHIQMAETYVLDLSKSEDDILSGMSKKTRKTLRRADRSVVVKKEENIDKAMEYFNSIYTATAESAKFSIQSEAYYKSILENMEDNIDVFAAYGRGGEDSGDSKSPIAFSWLLYTGQKSWQLYGGTNLEGKRLNANYALKWSAIIDSKENDRKLYDFNGRLEGGVADFKAKFGPKAVDLQPTMITYLSILGRAFEWIEFIARKLR